MRLLFVSNELPLPEGTATGRHLWTVCQALIAEGHQVRVWSWYPQPSGLPLPDWCDWRPAPVLPGWRAHLRSLRHPRAELGLLDWQPPTDDVVVVADDPPSYAVAQRAARGVLTVHYSVLLDAVGVRDLRAPVLQDWRAERAAVRTARLTTAFTERVARVVGADELIPAAVPLPAHPLPLVSEPVAALLADWTWPPNRAALRTLLRGWPRVRRRVRAARLLLAGRGALPRDPPEGVTLVGAVPRAVDLLSRAAVLAFPCPPSSGPKMKVLDALAHGVPVVTTPAGVEGIHGVAEAAVVAPVSGFADRLADVLAEPARRADMAGRGRAAVARHHDPQVAARARVRAYARLG